MGLILPRGPDWGFCAHNYGAAPESVNLGTAVTAGANNADGSAVTVLSALSRDVEYLKLYLHGSGVDATSGINPDISLTLLIDPAGGTSWANFIPNLLAGRVPTASLTSNRVPGAGYDFPLWIPAGASIGAMARTSHSSTLTVRVLAVAYGGNANPASWWCGQRVAAIGANPSASSGTMLTSGAASSFSSWLNLGSTLAADCGALQMGTVGEGSTTWSQGDLFIELGAGSTAIGGPIFRSQSTNEMGCWTPAGLNFKRVAAGTQLQVRAMNTLSAVTFGIAAYAVH